MAHESWGHRADGVVTLLGYTIGAGAVIKFPYLFARNGGGAFFIPYIIFLLIVGLPIYYLEIVVGQYFQKGPVQVWNLCPPFKGIGIGACMIGWCFATYSSVYYAWFFFYLYNSFRSTLPWTSCENDWNTVNCVSSFTAKNESHARCGNATACRSWNNNALSNVSLDNHTADFNWSSSGEEFWKLHTLSVSSGLHELGEIRAPLVVCLLIVFTLFYLFMFKNIKIQGKIVYFTVILPVVLLTAFLIRGVMLPGALNGILFYIQPDFDKLRNSKLWIEGSIVAFNSLGLASGVVITSASHNHWHSNCLRYALIVCFGDLIVNAYGGLVVFSVLGHLAFLKNTSLEAFQTSGCDIAFITLPETVAKLPLPQLWAVLFFLTLITFGFDSTVPCLEIIVTVLGDQFPALTKRRWLHVAIVIIPSFIFALIYTCQGGMYVLTLVDWFIWGPPITIFSIVEAVAIGWIFGIPRLSAATKEMYNSDIPGVMRILLKFVAPVMLLAIFIYSTYIYRPPQYGDYIYPVWANVIGWMIVAVIILPFPVWMFYTVWTARARTFRKKLIKAFQPKVMLCRQKREDEAGVDSEMTQPL